MEKLIVRTKRELQEALKAKPEYIIVKGDLADKLKKAEAISKLSKVSLGILTVALAATPLTGGVAGLVGLSAVAVSTGLSVPAIIIATALGIALILAVCKEYEEIEYDNGKLVLRKKRKK